MRESYQVETITAINPAGLGAAEAGARTRPSRSPARRGRGPADPPLLIGGSTRLTRREKVDRADFIGRLGSGFGELLSVAVDWLTVSVPARLGADTGAHLLAVTECEEVGGAQRGFARSELRKMMGGQVWRKFEPHELSREWGREYESWEASGGAGESLAHLVVGRRSRASRVDVAFDFACARALRADDVVEALERGAVDRGVMRSAKGRPLKVGREGAEHRTFYLGDRHASETFIRIYRKDVQSIAHAELFGPTMRVEVVVKKKEARRLWSLAAPGLEVLKRGASMRCRELIGVGVLQEDAVELPAMEVPEALDVAGQLHLVFRNHWATLAAAHDAGVDLARLLDEARATSSRWGRKRYRDRWAKLEGSGRAVEETVVDMLRRGTVRLA